jgi:Cu-processing system permease protein
LWRFELAGARRGWTVALVAAGFAVLSLAITFLGLSAGGVVAVQGFARTSVSLLQAVIWVVPALALLLGAVAGSECYELELVSALPVSRSTVVFARWAAWLTVLSAALGMGLGAAGVAIGLLAGAADGSRYLAFVGVSILLLAACLAVGQWIGVRARSRARAVAAAVIIWFVFVVGIDLVAIAVLAILPPGEAGLSLSLLLMADPVDAARTLGLSLFQADVVAGPTGAALRRVLGGWGAAVLVAALVAWTGLPLYFAGRRLSRADL